MSGLYTHLVSNVLFPLQERLKHHDTVNVRRQMEASQWWPAERIAALQVDRLKTFLTDIGTHVPYYRELFATRGFDPQTITSTARVISELRRKDFAPGLRGCEGE